MKATSGDRAATIGAMTPPSLWPIRPICLRVDLLAALEEGDAGQDVAGEVVAGRRRRAAGRAADAAVVDPEHGDPPPREVVGQDEERLVPPERLVAVLRPRAGDQEDGRERPLPLRGGEGAGQRDAGRLVRVGHPRLVVRIGRLRRLRPPGPGRRRDLLERQGERRAALLPLADGLGARLVQLAVVGGPDRFDREG